MNEEMRTATPEEMRAAQSGQPGQPSQQPEQAQTTLDMIKGASPDPEANFYHDNLVGKKYMQMKQGMMKEGADAAAADQNQAMQVQADRENAYAQGGATERIQRDAHEQQKIEEMNSRNADLQQLEEGRGMIQNIDPSIDTGSMSLDEIKTFLGSIGGKSKADVSAEEIKRAQYPIPE